MHTYPMPALSASDWGVAYLKCAGGFSIRPHPIPSELFPRDANSIDLSK